MTGKLGSALLAGAILAGVGCVNCRYKGYYEAAHPPEPPPFPIPIRTQVHLFMMNGTDLLELSDMLGLRDRLCQAGYPMVHYAQMMDADWYRRELRRVHRDEPGARLVLLGHGSSAATVHQLAVEAAADQIPLDAVVFLDPVGFNGNLAETAPFHTVVIRSHNWRGSRSLVGHEAVTLSNVGHFSAPAHPATVDAVVGVLTASAALVTVDHSAERLPHLPLRDHPAPTPRPGHRTLLIGPPDEWDFLKLQPQFPGSPYLSIP